MQKKERRRRRRKGGEMWILGKIMVVKISEPKHVHHWSDWKRESAGSKKF